MLRKIYYKYKISLQPKLFELQNAKYAFSSDNENTKYKSFHVHIMPFKISRVALHCVGGCDNSGQVVCISSCVIIIVMLAVLLCLVPWSSVGCPCLTVLSPYSLPYWSTLFLNIFGTPSPNYDKRRKYKLPRRYTRCQPCCSDRLLDARDYCDFSNFGMLHSE